MISLGIGVSLIFLLPKPVKLNISAQDISLNVGETKTIEYDINKKANVTFEIADSQVAKVSNFRIIGQKSGETVLKITAFVGKESCTCVCKVSVFSTEENKQSTVEPEKPSSDPSEPKTDDENKSDEDKEGEQQPVDPPKQDQQDDDDNSKQDQNDDNKDSDSNVGEDNQGQSGEEKQDKDENTTPDPSQDKGETDPNDDDQSLEDPKDEPSDKEESENKIEFTLEEVRNCRIDGKTIYITAGKEARFMILHPTYNEEVIFTLSSDQFEISQAISGFWKFTSETGGVITVKVDGVVIGEILVVVE